MLAKFGLAKLGILVLASIPVARAADSVAFQDPIEKAFTLDVPSGWTVKGGMFRLGYSDYRIMVDMKSPDGKVNVRLGDISVPTYAVPNPFHPREGGIVDLGAQTQMTVARYRPGPAYASDYARVRFHETCTSLAPQAVTAPLPIPDVRDEAGVRQSSQGEAGFQCDGARTAYVYAKTVLYDMFWQVPQLASFVAPADQVPAARSVIERAIKSFKLADAWIQYQKKLDQEAQVYQQAFQQNRRRVLSQQVAQFEMQMNAMQGQVAAFEHRQATQAKQVEGWGNILTGITPTTDPYGNTHNVWTGPKSGYWTDGKGNYLNSIYPQGRDGKR